MAKINCWEFKKCGRQPGGAKTDELGVCQAAVESKLNGAHGGRNAGRACWVVAGTLCGGKPQGSFACKIMNCVNCDFYRSVRQEENKDFILSKDLIERLRTGV